MPAVDTEPFKRKTRVRVTEALPGVPEGAAGTVKDTVGFALPRHRVAFDNGRLVTSVARSKLVREEEWDDFVAEREATSTAEAEAATATEEAPTAEAAAEGGGEGSPADDRLAALLARSKAAREKKATDA